MGLIEVFPVKWPELKLIWKTSRSKWGKVGKNISYPEKRKCKGPVAGGNEVSLGYWMKEDVPDHRVGRGLWWYKTGLEKKAEARPFRLYGPCEGF